MNELIDRVLALVDKDRIKETFFDLVKIPSPTGAGRPLAERYADILREIGCSDVKLIDTVGWPDAPCVVGWRRGKQAGPTLHFNGHLDHAHQPHVSPYVDGDKVAGRGAADMKFGLAGMVELVRVLNLAGADLPGDLLLSGHDMHEGPIGHGEGVRSLVGHGYVGDAVVVAEGSRDAVYPVGKSSCFFKIDLKRHGASMHELVVSPGTPNLLEIGGAVVVALTALKQRVAQRVDSATGAESMFLSILQSGDFYNRLPTSCHIVGIRRLPPEVQRSDVAQEIRQVVESVTAGMPIEVIVDGTEGNDGFRISPDEKIVRDLCYGYEAVHGKHLALGVQHFGADNAKFINLGGVPAVGYGLDLTRAHSELEWMDVGDVAAMVKVLLVTTLHYFGLA